MKKVSLLLSLGFFLVWFAAFRPLVLGGRTSYIIVSGISMEPTLQSGDLAVLLRQSAYQPGDVVAYRVTGGQVIHRIVTVTARGYRTQGDNKQQVDPWLPTDEAILGKMWFSIPRAGQALTNLRQPVSLGMIALLGALVILDEPLQKRVRRRGKRMKTNTWTTPSHVEAALRSRLSASTTAAPAGTGLDLTWLLYTCGFFGLMVMLALALGLYSYRQPLTQSLTVDWLRYTHRAAYQYSVQTEPTALTAGGAIGPIRATEDLSAAPPAVFTRVAKTIAVDFQYRLQSSLPALVQGETAPELELRKDDLVLTSIPLGTALPFSGSEVIRRMNIPVAEILALIDSIEEQFGYTAGSYTAALVPNLRLTGSVGDRAIDEGVQPELTFQINDSQIRFDPLQDWSDEKVIQETMVVPNEIGVGRLKMPVSEVRLLSPWLGGLSLLGVLFTGFTAYWALKRDENTRIRTRYGGLIATVAEMKLHSDRVVRVASIHDLVRLSQRFNCMILHKVQPDRSHLYLIPDGEVLYLYRVDRPIHEG